MREIKFRAWLPKEKQMIDNDEISLTEGRVFRRVYYPDTGFMNAFPKDDAKLMQYTGLKDKNGKEIYEGDLIKITDPFINQEAIGVAEIVFSHDYVGGWVAESRDNHLNIGTRTHMVGVVGNIYEHPELIKE